MLSFILFIFDFCVANLYNEWLVRALIAYFFYLILYSPGDRYRAYTTFFLVMIQNSHIYGGFGLGLIILLPLIVIGAFVRTIVHRLCYPFLYVFLIVFYVLGEFFLINSWESTITRIFSTIMVGFLILLGTRGNRFLRK